MSTQLLPLVRGVRGEGAAMSDTKVIYMSMEDNTKYTWYHSVTTPCGVKKENYE